MCITHIEVIECVVFLDIAYSSAIDQKVIVHAWVVSAASAPHQ
jgi:hypothetical protein